MKTAGIIGSGPAGLMAAEVLAARGLHVTVYDAKPSFGRKFLMAGKSGLNLTKDEPIDQFLEAFAEAKNVLSPIVRAFDSRAVQAWARALDQEVFVGSTGRVFPQAMKASPLLRAWLRRLSEAGVVFRTGWTWQGWDGTSLVFDHAQGRTIETPEVTILALGGASWPRLGSTGNWADVLEKRGVALTPFAAANAGVSLPWSAHMAAHFGRALKNIAWSAGDYLSRGEAVISRNGLEGGGIYSVSRGLRDGAELLVDLMPDMSVQEITARLSKPRGKTTLSNHLRKTLKLAPAQIALLQEMGRPLPDGLRATARLIKALPLKGATLSPMKDAISTAGGVPFVALDDGLMLLQIPGVFVAGEMLDWEAPTGGYLITAAMATGRWAAEHAANWSARTSA